MELWRITAGGKRPFCAGFVFDDKGWVAECAPILRQWIKGRGEPSIRALCRERGWLLEKVQDPTKGSSLICQ